MKLPFLPIHVDGFVRSSDVVTFAASGSARHCVYFLSHAHTDHMAGLTPYWQGGLLFCSSITREILLQRMEEEAHQHGSVGGPHDRQEPQGLSLADRCIALPFWQRIPLLTTVNPNDREGAGPAKSSHSSDEDSSVVLLSGPSSASEAGAAALLAASVFVTLLPAFHIPGSAMLYFETPRGRLLYTGDFKFDPISAAPILTEFFRDHPVDDIFIDDTWLHLGVTVSTGAYVAQELSCFPGHLPNGEGAEDSGTRDCRAPPSSSSACSVDSGTKVLSKLLNAAQVEEAVEAIGRRLDAQRRRFLRDCDAVWAAEEAAVSAHDRPQLPALPYVLRVYLHNQFGKEMLVQRIAERLGTCALLDDSRFARVAIVSAALNAGDDIDSGCDDGEDDVIAAAFANSRESAPLSPAPPTRPSSSTSAKSSAVGADAQRWEERSFYHLHLRHFVSRSQRDRQLAEIHSLRVEAKRLSATEEDSMEAKAARWSRLRELYEALPLVEVVDSRARVSSEALQQAARSGPLPDVLTPHYGVIMSGWARLQPGTRQQSSEVWHVPTTLHCTPQELIDFVAVLRPRSVTPLHYRASRSPVVLMQRLGPYLRRPFVNELFAPEASGTEGGGGSRDALNSAVGGEAARGWFGLVALPHGDVNSSPETAPREGMTHDGVALLGRRQRGFMIRRGEATASHHPMGSASTSSGIAGGAVSSQGSVTSSVRSVTDVDRMLHSQDVNASGSLVPPWQLAALCESYERDVEQQQQRRDGPTTGSSRKRRRRPEPLAPPSVSPEETVYSDGNDGVRDGGVAAHHADHLQTSVSLSNATETLLVIAEMLLTNNVDDGSGPEHLGATTPSPLL